MTLQEYQIKSDRAELSRLSRRDFKKGDRVIFINDWVHHRVKPKKERYRHANSLAVEILDVREGQDGYTQFLILPHDSIGGNEFTPSWEGGWYAPWYVASVEEQVREIGKL